MARANKETKGGGVKKAVVCVSILTSEVATWVLRYAQDEGKEREG